MHLCLCEGSFGVSPIRGVGRMEPVEGPPVSSPDPAIIDSVEQPASSSTRAVTDMPFDSPAVMTHTLHMRDSSISMRCPHATERAVMSTNKNLP